MTREQRRLAAIVCADVAGYSRLMGRNDSGTLAALKTHRRELIDPKVAEHGGRIVKTTGDGLLLEFQSVVDAVRFAVDVQRGMGWRNGGVPADQRIEFRMGVNVGDLIIDGDDLYGDGVNVAARLQALAEPGGIWASKAVRDQVADKVGFAFDELGARQVKNIERPIEAYRIRDEPGAADARPATHRLKLFWRVAAGSRRPLLAVLAIAAIAAGAATWYVLVQTRAPATGAGPPLMSLAVMPFAPASPSDQDERLAERLTQDVTSAAERAMRFALIASHGRVSGYKGSPFEPRAVGRDLNVRYLLEGSIRTGTGQLTLVARLVETESGKQLWSTSLTSAAPSSRGVGDIVPQLINRLRLALYDAEKKRIANMPMTGGASAMELVLRAEALEDRDPSLGSARAARKLYEEALRQDPGSAPALSGLYFTLRTQLDENSSVDRVRLTKEMNDVSVRAVRADREDPRVWLLRSDALGWQHQWDGALAANAEALRIDPYRNGALLNRVELLIETGRADEVFPIIAQGMALDPRSPAVPGFLYRECRAHLFLGHYDAAIASCEKGIGLDTDYWLFAHVLLIAAYGQTGENAKAAAARAGLLERKAWISISSLKARRESDIPTYMQQQEVHLYPGLRKAGIPEQ